MAIVIPDRSAEDRVAGVIRVDVGGATKRLPTLPMTAAEAWIEGLGAQVAKLASQLAADEGDVAAVMGFVGGSLTAVLDAVASYDKTGALGGREWLADNADPEQLYVAFRQIVKVVFPFVEELGGLQKLLPGLLQAASSRPGSTNGPSPAGASIPEPSAIDSTPSSSTSSGRRARSEPAASTASA